MGSHGKVKWEVGTGGAGDLESHWQEIGEKGGGDVGAGVVSFKKVRQERFELSPWAMGCWGF